MAILFFLLANVMLFVRPAEIFPGLEGLQIYLVMILAAGFFSMPELRHQLKWKTMLNQPITICVIGVMTAVCLSHMTNFYAGGVLKNGVEFAKILIYYTLLVAIVNTPDRFRSWLVTISLSATVMVGLSVLDYMLIVDFENIKHIVETHGRDEVGRDIKVIRMCGSGIFHDPNDISLLIVCNAFLCFYFLAEPVRRNNHQLMVLFARGFWLFPLFVLATGLLCTRSRGGLLAAGAGVVAWLVIRYGKIAAVGAFWAGALLVPVMLGRQGQISLSGGTGQQRIRLWSDGLVAIQSPKVFFGMGVDSYDEIAGLVAHNSYIHAFVEMGLFGGTFFFGCFFFAFLGLYRIQKEKIPVYHPEMDRFKAYMTAILAGWCIGMCSLSRCYVEPTYMIAGMATCYFNLVGLYQFEPKPIIVWNKVAAQRMIAGSFVVFVGAFVFVKLFARWG